jgi:hypothetical protein
MNKEDVRIFGYACILVGVPYGFLVWADAINYSLMGPAYAIGITLGGLLIALLAR